MTRDISHQSRMRLNSRSRSRSREQTSRSRSREHVMARFPASVVRTTPPNSPRIPRRRNVYITSPDSDDDAPLMQRLRRRFTFHSSSDQEAQSPRYSTPSPLYGGYEEVEEEPELDEGYEIEEEPQLDGGHEVEEPQLENAVVLSKPEVLDCPICLDPLTLPVYQCEEGHLACGSCSNNNEIACPSCSLPTRYSRCRGIEQVLESAIAPCRNRAHGCQVKVSYGKKLEHEKSCNYTTWPCPHDGCVREFYVFNWNLFNQHFSSLHSTSVQIFQNNASTTILLRKDTNRVFLQENYGSRVFVLNRLIDPLGSLISVVCLAPTPLLANYTYRLTARSGDRKICLRSHVEVTLDCRSTQPPKRNCLLITSDFADYLDRLELQLVISRLE